MSKNKQGDWTDYIGESQMPADAMTFTDASTFGLDGFQFDTPDNEGVLKGPDYLPEARGMSGLPDGVVRGRVLEEVDLRGMTETDEGFHLGSMLDESDITSEEQRKEASLVDLDWLDPTQPQDPDRLPKDNIPGEPPLDSSPELEDAWGVDRRTDGVHLVPNSDLEALRYEESLDEGQPHSDLPGNKNAKEIALSALRKAHLGVPIKTIKKEIVAALGHDARALRKVVARIEAEFGLLGNVYVRASAFPGLRNGKWVKEIKRRCASARYVITDDDAVATKLGMEAVAEVPWKAAYRHYAPRLKAAGYVITDSGKRALKSAFLAGPQEAVHQPTPKPEGVVMAKSPEVVNDSMPIVTPEKQAGQRKLRGALVQIAKWVKAGKLTQKDALRLHEFARRDSIRPESILKAASDIIMVSLETPTYKGVGLDKAGKSARAQVWESLENQQAEVDAALLKKAHVKLAKAVKAGQLTKKEAQRLVASCSTVSELNKKMAAAIQAAPAMRDDEITFEETATYEGTPQRAAPVVSQHIPDLDPWTKRAVEAVKGKDHKAGEVLGLVRWARMQMSEGRAGDDLDVFLRARFSSGLLDTASEMLEEMRVAHEGLSGHLYVDAEAYASPKGLTGCEKGALKHRANQIKTVLAMGRCRSCVHKNAVGICSLYNKRLVDSPPTPDPTEYQKKAIHFANAPDHEVTVSLFNPSEFDLRASDDIDLDPDVPAEVLSEVLFGGWEL